MRKLQSFAHLMRKAKSFEKILMLGKIEGKRRGQQRMMDGLYHQFNGQELGQTLGDSERQWSLECCSPLGFKELDMT